MSILASSHRWRSVKKAVLKNFAIFKGKHLCWSLPLIKLQAIRPATLQKRDSNTGLRTTASTFSLLFLIFKSLFSWLFQEPTLLRDESHVDFRTHCIIMTQKTWPPDPCYLRHFQIFDQIDSFPKHFLNVFRKKR